MRLRMKPKNFKTTSPETEKPYSGAVSETAVAYDLDDNLSEHLNYDYDLSTDTSNTAEKLFPERTDPS